MGSVMKKSAQSGLKFGVPVHDSRTTAQEFAVSDRKGYPYAQNLTSREIWFSVLLFPDILESLHPHSSIPSRSGALYGGIPLLTIKIAVVLSVDRGQRISKNMGLDLRDTHQLVR
jgi:hypothetical protein